MPGEKPAALRQVGASRCCETVWKGITCYKTEVVSVVERHTLVGLMPHLPSIFLLYAMALRLLTINTCYARRPCDYQCAPLNCFMQWRPRCGVVCHGFHARD